MAHIDFRGRPVAALAQRDALHAATPRPGSTLDLAVDIESCDDEAVAYSGRGVRRRRGASIELVDCLGPMLPVAEFDSPDALAERFALLRDGGAPPGRFHGVAAAARRRATSGVPGASATRDAATCRQSAPFFGDHFPRRAGVSGDAAARRADPASRSQLAREATHWPAGTPTRVRSRMTQRQGALVHRRRAQRLDLDAELAPPATAVADGDAHAVGAQSNGKTVAHRARSSRVAGADERMAAHESARVAITGIGLVTPVGNDVATTLGRAARRPQRRRADHAVRRERLLRRASPPR